MSSGIASRKSCSRCKHVQCTCRGPGPVDDDDPSEQPPSNRSLAPDDPVGISLHELFSHVDLNENVCFHLSHRQEFGFAGHVLGNRHQYAYH
jgi:hypothetical protein